MFVRLKRYWYTKKFVLFFFCIVLGYGVSVSQIDRNSNTKKETIIAIPLGSSGQVEKPKTLDRNDTNGFQNAYRASTDIRRKEQEKRELEKKGILTEERIRKEQWEKSFDDIHKKIKRVDQYLGNFRTNSKHVRIICRDYVYPDGDRVSIYANEIPVVRNIVLTSAYQEFTIPLVKGINKIAFKALNQGTSGSNTAEFQIYDDTGTLLSSNEWRLASGATATFLIAKDG